MITLSRRLVTGALAGLALSGARPALAGTAALAEASGWVIETHERRERPAGAVSTHHVHDVVLRARREG